jgi:hypothetical protein
MKNLSVIILVAVSLPLSIEVVASNDRSTEPLLLAAAEERQERREERGRSDERQDRRDCRQEEGRVGKDKRECKQLTTVETIERERARIADR